MHQPHLFFYGDSLYTFKDPQNFTTMNRSIGIILIVLGAAMLIWTGFTYTKKEKIIDAGPIQVSADKRKSVNWPPYLGGLLVIGGIVVITTARKN